LVEEFVMASGESVSAGDLVTWMEGEAYGPAPRWGEERVYYEDYVYEMDMTTLSASDFIIAYRDYGTGHGVAITGTLDGMNIVWGNPSIFHANNTYGMRLAALSESEFVIGYMDGGNSNHGTAIAGTLSGGGLFWGSPSVFNPASTHNIGVAALSGTEMVVTYGDGGNGNYGTAITGTLSGGSLTWGSESVFHPATTYEINVAAPSSTEIAVAYRDYDDGSQGTAIPATVSEGSFSWGNESIFNPASTSHLELVALSSTQVAAAYRDEGNDAYGTVRVATLSGADLIWDDEDVFNVAGTYGIGAAALSATEMVVTYRDSGNDDYGTARLGEVVGGDVVWSREAVFKPGAIDATVAAALPASDFVVAYREQNEPSGRACIPNQIGRRPIGTALNAAGEGEGVRVVVEGIADLPGGLVPGQVYYWQGDGSLGTAPTLTRVGLALSETELLLDRLWPQ
jgi:hypothetical protein